MAKFNFKKWLKEHSDWENCVLMLFGITARGTIYVTDSEDIKESEGETLQDACENYDKKRKRI